MELRIDHVLLAVADLGVAAERIGTTPGLTALPGGRHPGVGTANMIIPFGRDYLELIAVVDESEAALMARSQRVRAAVDAGRTFAGWAVRADDLAELRASLQEIGIPTRDPFDGGRVRPDGTRLSWRTLELEHPAPADPFFIEWQVPAGAHPAATPAVHRLRASGIRRINVGSGGRVTEMLIEAGLPLAIVGGSESGIASIELETPTGPVLIR